MKLNSGTRVNLFSMGQDLSNQLGTLFQNPGEITPEMLNEELELYYKLRAEEFLRWEAYKWAVGELLCFPENIK